MSCGSLPPSSAAAVLASRAEIPIRIAPVTSFSSAQRPVSSSSSSQRVSCFGNSVLPSVRSLVTTSVRVGGGGLLWPGCSPPSPRLAPGGGGWAGGCGRLGPPPPPRRVGGGGGGGGGGGVVRHLQKQRCPPIVPPPPTP